ncbi:hypothetical protein CMO88_01300 [Candidatus Woesearchaeota archaeon]|nr:hypothetical protein [Candidatus Woesearchaeota archaeon]|tara:strand:+ start:12999 stop:13424 length:426 start_codon:yes stop_codon:yes gene_type:complete
MVVKNLFLTMKWKKEIARDILALGGLPFYFIVLIRAIIGDYNLFVYQLLMAIAVLYILYFFVKQANLHIARGFIVSAFTSLFYKEIIFTVFAFFLWLAALASLFYLKTKPANIVKGIIIGIISAVVAYYSLTNFLNSPITF